jgi:Amt family ammonium transporter
MRRDWDDALDVWGVHGIGGGLGTILTGVFAVAAINGVTGLVAGDWRQFGVQVLGVVIAGAYSFVVTFGILKLINIFTPVRVDAEAEAQGLDELLHGEAAYSEPTTVVAATTGKTTTTPPSSSQARSPGR